MQGVQIYAYIQCSVLLQFRFRIFMQLICLCALCMSHGRAVDRLCFLTVRIPGYNPIGPGIVSRLYQIF
jgi:hypothetical protein